MSVDASAGITASDGDKVVKDSRLEEVVTGINGYSRGRVPNIVVGLQRVCLLASPSMA